MSMASSLLLSIIALFLSLSTIPTQSQSTVYEILPKFGLPAGLLPDCVSSYTFNPTDGSFEVDLAKPCYVQFDYLVYYEKVITGTLKLGSIINLKGIQVKSLFLWFTVSEIKVDLPPGDSIYFQVGIINKKLNVHQFDTVHTCNSGVALSSSGSLTSELTHPRPIPVDDGIAMILTE